MTLRVVRITAALRRRFQHVEQAEGTYPVDVAKVALADELIATVQDQLAERVARLPARSRRVASAGLAVHHRARRRVS